MLVKRPMINLEASDTTGWTALHFAMKQNFEEMVEVLASAGADGNYKNMAGDSPIDIALKGGNRAILKLYEDTVQGVGRLQKQERVREKEPEKQFGVLKEEGTADAVFTHKKFTEDELMMRLKLAEQELKQEQEQKAEKEKEHVHHALSPRRLTTLGKKKDNKKEDKKEEKEKEEPKSEDKAKGEIEVVGGWTHKTKSEQT